VSTRAKTIQPRRRLDAAAARERILDVAEKRLAAVGPSGIRLQDVAAEAGVSHPNVLHHFGSRELLVKAVIARSMRAINASLVEAIRASTGEKEQLEAMIEGVAATLDRMGHGRVVMWLALEGHAIDGADARLIDVVEAAHTLRRSRNKRASRDDTARTVVLGALALCAGSVMAPMMLENAGLSGDPRAIGQFRKWLARLLVHHLDRDRD
jgi:AcrR family transcriptional regulator